MEFKKLLFGCVATAVFASAASSVQASVQDMTIRQTGRPMEVLFPDRTAARQSVDAGPGDVFSRTSSDNLRFISIFFGDPNASALVFGENKAVHRVGGRVYWDYWLMLYGPSPVPEVAAAIPETSSWGMMLLGLAGLSFIGYRRNRSKPLQTIA